MSMDIAIKLGGRACFNQGHAISLEIVMLHVLIQDIWSYIDYRSYHIWVFKKYCNEIHIVIGQPKCVYGPAVHYCISEKKWGEVWDKD